MRIITNISEAKNLFLGKNRTSYNKQKQLTLQETVKNIIDQVITEGDIALINLTKKYDQVKLENIKISESIIKQSISNLDDEIKYSIQFSYDRILNFHKKSTSKSWYDENEGYGENFTPIENVGVYIPSNLLSTVLMTVIPAKVVGVNNIFVTTPPNKSGLPSSEILYACELTGVTNIYVLGGTQAIAALAFGTETVPKVDFICGPGNSFVTEAKRQVFGHVGIDGIFGPTETLILADDSANPTLCAADLLAQAEHDTEAKPLIITTSTNLANQVKEEIYLRINNLPRYKIAKSSIENNGAIIVVNNIKEMFDFCNEFGPEHVSIVIENPQDSIHKIQNAGAIFIGDYSHEVLGDYIAGPSHVMPTGGAAKFSSGINTRTFLKSSPVINLSKSTVQKISHSASIISNAEGLHAHANAAEIRLDL